MNDVNGSMWRIWDMQVQTIQDDVYVPLKTYYEALKQAKPQKWQEYIGKVGGEPNALLYDSKEYFYDTRIPKSERVLNYVRNFFAFVETFSPHLAVIGITDHNYDDDELIDAFVNYSKRTKLQVIPGVEINVGGIHMLVFFSIPILGQTTFSESIKT